MNCPVKSRTLSKVVSVNTADVGGGAERMAWTLFKGFQKRGLESWLVVGDKKTADPNVMPFFLSPHVDYRPYAGSWPQRRLKWLKRIDRALGLEDFRFPYSKHLPTITGRPPEVIHCHNLHGGYFDLRSLSALSHHMPVCLTLHDCWCLTGHCAYPFGCERWRTGCGACPSLATPPAIKRDGTRWNWRRKRDIYSQSRLYVAASSNWLLGRAAESMLAPAIVESRLIPYGIDLDIFKPGPRQEARRQLGIPADIHMALFVGYQGKSSPFKDYDTMRAAMARLAAVIGRDFHFICVGEEAPDERLGRLLIRHIPNQTAAEQLAPYYRAADVYVHAARSEVFGLVIAEAMACGTPVVATRVGGIPQVFADKEQGFLVPPGDSESMSRAVAMLLDNPDLRRKMGQQASERAQRHFDQHRMINDYIDWFTQILEARH